MIRIRQALVKRIKFVKKLSKSALLMQTPFKKGVCIKVFKASPKKPNSGNRSVARILLSNKKSVLAHIPGELNTLSKHSVVLVRGARLPDLPSCNYKIIRGKYDATPVVLRKTSRSKYGTKKQ